MTWNVWGRFGDRWLRRQRAIATTVGSQRPDFVALQETWPAQTEVLGFELGMTSVFAPSRMPQDPEVHLGLGILSRFPLLRVERHALSSGTRCRAGRSHSGLRSGWERTACTSSPAAWTGRKTTSASESSKPTHWPRW
ncbi:endonuclease/exonuclease/phosphatase family protein [Kribbella sp. WER1]